MIKVIFRNTIYTRTFAIEFGRDAVWENKRYKFMVWIWLWKKALVIFIRGKEWEP